MRDHLSLYFYRRRNEAGSRLLSRSENVRNSSRARRTSTGEYPYTSENFSTFRFCIIIIYFSLSLLLAKILFISFFFLDLRLYKCVYLECIIYYDDGVVVGGNCETAIRNYLSKFVLYETRYDEQRTI